ncbi:putative nuclease HARBI1, partial [Orussus abietinus]|uniref:putative nuclease HARBI1 n=1 Tax=Orussus abietinus TaxID=222816 RepID=UPI000C715EB0
MAEHFLEWELLVLENRVRQLERRIEMRRLRDAQNPFDLPYNEFLKHFRLSPELVMDIVNTLRPRLERERIHGLSPEVKVLVAINFYANGSYQNPVGANMNLIVSQPSASRCIRKVTDLINQHFLRRWIRFPMTPEERQQARTAFTNAAQPFEGAIGAIDCTHINILAPREHEEAYVNHHGNHSVNVQVIVDQRLKI